MSDRSREYPTDAALVRLVQGECLPAERREIQRWMEADPAHRARVDEFRAIWTARAAPVRWNVNEMWAGVRDSMAGDPPAAPLAIVDAGSHRRLTPRSRRASGQRGEHSRGIAWAVTIVLAVGGGTLLAVASERRSHAQPLAGPMREYVTARGERATLELADGSRVILAPESHVRVPGTFGIGGRDFFLDGEAIFEVVHDSSSPFRVHAKRAMIEDIGTRFDVRAYENDPTVAVVVAEGSVTLARAKVATEAGSAYQADRVVLGKRQLGRLDSAGQLTTTSGVPLGPYLGWADGRLVFVDAALPEVVRRIGRWHDLDVRVVDARLASRRVTAEFSTQSSGEMLSALAAAVGARVERTGRVVTLRVAP
jgi:transmembrane sensor